MSCVCVIQDHTSGCSARLHANLAWATSRLQRRARHHEVRMVLMTRFCGSVPGTDHDRCLVPITAAGTWCEMCRGVKQYLPQHKHLKSRRPRRRPQEPQRNEFAEGLADRFVSGADQRGERGHLGVDASSITLACLPDALAEHSDLDRSRGGPEPLLEDVVKAPLPRLLVPEVAITVSALRASDDDQPAGARRHWMASRARNTAVRASRISASCWRSRCTIWIVADVPRPSVYTRKP